MSCICQFKEGKNAQENVSTTKSTTSEGAWFFEAHEHEGRTPGPEVSPGEGAQASFHLVRAAGVM
jgi:hypothetical protein